MRTLPRSRRACRRTARCGPGSEIQGHPEPTTTHLPHPPYLTADPTLPGHHLSRNVEYEQKLLSTTTQNRNELAALSREKGALERRVETLGVFQAQRGHLENRRTVLERELGRVRTANQKASKDSIDRNEDQKNQLRREMRSMIAETKVVFPI